MKSICLQSGHWGKAGGGAPEEQANNKRITDRLSAMMRERGFQVYQTDWYANNDSVVTKTDYDLFLALHCDMDYPNDGGSGFADYADPSTDNATKESQRICKIINEVYFQEAGINYVSHSNANTRFYYMWKYLTPETPCVLLEMGQSIDPHDKILLANTDLIASSIARALCKAFDVAYDIVPPQNVEDKFKELEKKIKDLSESLVASQKEVQTWQGKLDSANKSNLELKNQMAILETKCEELSKYERMSGWDFVKLGVQLLIVKK